MLDSIRKFKTTLLQVDSRTIYLYSLLSGLMTGSVAVLFHKAILLFHGIFYENVAHSSMFSPASVLNEGPTDWGFRHLVLLVLPAFGGLISGILCFYYAPEAAGGGIYEFLD